MLTVVIAALNEESSLDQLCEELQAVAIEHQYDLEIIIVDDGSTDGTWRVIQKLSERLPQVQGIRLRRNFGKAAALATAFQNPKGELVITMDADLQDDPRDIPKFLDRIEQGFDVVCGWKRRRLDPWDRVIGSRMFNWLVRRLTGVMLHDHNCGFKCCRRHVLAELDLYGELHRFIPVMAASMGYSVTEVEVHHRPRKYGRSRYGFSRIPKGLLDLITVQFLTGFRYRPQHLLGTVGLAGFGVGFLALFCQVLWWFASRSALFDGVQPIHLHERPIFYLAIAAMMLGSQFLAAGFLAELLVAISPYRSGMSQVSVVERVGSNEESSTATAGPPATIDFSTRTKSPQQGS